VDPLNPRADGTGSFKLTARETNRTLFNMATWRCLAKLLGFLLVSALTAARGELVLTDYSPANPLKIMAVGDSITDDGVTNGAWRLFLQPLLETNGYHFTFVGRQSSSPAGGFTKTAHEGYSGAVIAPPGVLTYSVHGYNGPDVYMQRIASDALTNVIPDLVLVLMGANDIGRGRDPWVTATNDMANLLNLIFSNAPNAHVILAKITTLRDAAVGTLNYYLNVGKVPIYNAALQGLVNQRRAAGQNVFLADMYSVVDYNTMFNSDHLHPNPLGLQAIAGEWLTRIRSITVRPDLVVSVLVKGGDSWKYFDAGQDLGTNWMRPEFDDSGWSNGSARLGYGDLVYATKVSYGPSSNNKYPTTYFRHTFVVPENVAFTNLVLRLAQRSGALVWLNGQELWRTNLPAGPITYTNLATPYAVNFDTYYLFNPVTVDAAQLLPGTNVIAVGLHQGTTNGAAIGVDLELIGTGHPISLPILSFAATATNLVLTWPADAGAGFGLYAATNPVAANWTPASPLPQTNGGQLSVTQAMDPGNRFFRLQKP
jgi:lysophospholipase L1-like esterase